MHSDAASQGDGGLWRGLLLHARIAGDGAFARTSFTPFMSPVAAAWVPMGAALFPMGASTLVPIGSYAVLALLTRFHCLLCLPA